jgi:hypothetical protein
MRVVSLLCLTYTEFVKFSLYFWLLNISRYYSVYSLDVGSIQSYSFDVGVIYKMDAHGGMCSLGLV